MTARRWPRGSVDPTAADWDREIRPLRGNAAGTKPWGQGPLAQLVAHRFCKAGVRSSSLLGSTDGE